CLAEGLDHKGELHTIDVNEELEERVQGYFDASPFREHITYHIGDAAEIIPTIDGDFDLVFIDADKKSNLYYFETLISRVSKGGLLLIDNVLWKGKVLASAPDRSEEHTSELQSRENLVCRLLRE